MVTFNIQQVERSLEVKSEGLNCRKVGSARTNLGQYGKIHLDCHNFGCGELFLLVLGNFLSKIIDKCFFCTKK